MVKVTDENISMMRKIIADQNKETAETLEKNKKKKGEGKTPNFQWGEFFSEEFNSIWKTLFKIGSGIAAVCQKTFSFTEI